MVCSRAFVFSLSLSFPSQSLSRFEERGVFISCAYLLCLCGKKNLSKLLFFCCMFQGSKMQQICWKKGEDKQKKNTHRSSFLDTKEHWLLLNARRKNTEYYSPRHVVPKERERWGNHREGESQLSSRRKKRQRRHFLKKDITIERRSGKSTTKRTNKDKRKTHRWRCEGNGTKNTEYSAAEILRAVLVLKRRRWIRCWY